MQRLSDFAPVVHALVAHHEATGAVRHNHGPGWRKQHVAAVPVILRHAALDPAPTRIPRLEEHALLDARACGVAERRELSLGLPGGETALAAGHREEMAIVLRVDCEIALVRVVLRADLCQVTPRATLVVRPDDDIAEDVRGLSTLHVIVVFWRVLRGVGRRRHDGGGEAHGARRRFDK